MFFVFAVSMRYQTKIHIKFYAIWCFNKYNYHRLWVFEHWIKFGFKTQYKSTHCEVCSTAATALATAAGWISSVKQPNLLKVAVSLHLCSYCVSVIYSLAVVCYFVRIRRLSREYRFSGRSCLVCRNGCEFYIHTVIALTCFFTRVCFHIFTSTILFLGTIWK